MLRWFAAIWFGPLAILVYFIMRRKSSRRESNLDLSNALLSDDELVELARQRKRSFVARYDDIKWARIERPDALERLLAGRNFQGTVTFRETTVGKVTICIFDRQSMETAIGALQRRLGDRVDNRAVRESR